jgi:hypothetical protein
MKNSLNGKLPQVDGRSLFVSVFEVMIFTRFICDPQVVFFSFRFARSSHRQRLALPPMNASSAPPPMLTRTPVLCTCKRFTRSRFRTLSTVKTAKVTGAASCRSLSLTSDGRASDLPRRKNSDWGDVYTSEWRRCTFVAMFECRSRLCLFLLRSVTEALGISTRFVCNALKPPQAMLTNTFLQVRAHMRDKNHVVLDVETCAEEVEEYYNLDDDGWEDEVLHLAFAAAVFLSADVVCRASGRMMKRAQLRWIPPLSMQMRLLAGKPHAFLAVLFI